MNNIMITKSNGTIVPIAQKSTATAITSALQTWELNGNDIVNITVESPYTQNYDIGDKITVFGRDYKINRLPHVTKNGNHSFTYNIEFEGVQYDLIRVMYDLTIDTTNNRLQDVQGDSLTANLKNDNNSGFAQVLISNANRVFPQKWQLGECPEDTEFKTLTFGESDNCLLVLQNLCTEFNVEFKIEQENGIYTINFYEKVGQIFPATFQFGKGKGIYQLTRQNVDSSNIVTRLKVFGSNQNITHRYRAQRLCLPGKSKGQSYIEKQEAIEQYGIYEASKYFEDIKPSFTGSVKGILQGSLVKFFDWDMDFDLNEKWVDTNTDYLYWLSQQNLPNNADNRNIYKDSVVGSEKYLLPGVKAKIHFNTGNLAGYEFELDKYSNVTKTFTIIPITDERKFEIPSKTDSAFRIGLGDTYTILDIAMPQSYIDNAESKLLDAGNKYYEQNSQPKVQYGLSTTIEWLKKIYVGNGTIVNIFAPGDYIPIKDTDIGVDKSVRIKSLTRNVLKEYEYNLTISDTVSANITNRVISELIEQDKVLVFNNLKNPARARANWRTSQEVMNAVFDPDGYFTDKIRPESIETIALRVGAKSMQFALSGTIITPNYNGNENVIVVIGGVLVHYTIDEDNAVTWNLTNSTTTLVENVQYYVYAKCDRNSDSGAIIFTIEKITTEQDPNFYHFWIGMLSSIDTQLQERIFTPMYGFTSINGRFIRTGRIESADGNTYFDLDKSEMGGKIVFVNSDGTETIIDAGKLQTGRIEVGTSGLSAIDNLSDSVRIWAGSTFANRNSAPFRVLQDGSAIMSKATISSAISGKRIVVDGANGTLEHYNRYNEKVVEITSSNTPQGAGSVELYDEFGKTEMNASAITSIDSYPERNLDMIAELSAYGGIGISSRRNGVDDWVFKVHKDSLFTVLNVIMKGLPTSASNLISGQLWRDSDGYVRIV